MPKPSSRPTALALWIAVALLCTGAVVTSFALTLWWSLSPCYLCIFQRGLFMLLGPLAVLAAIAERRSRRLARVPGGLFALGAAAGAAAAAYQSWLQLRPVGSISCVGGQPGPIERLVEWAGQQAPDLFMASGFCEDEALVVLGLSLANWALVAFLSCLAAAGWALWRAPGARSPVARRR